jgi:hypothetical protein
MNGFDEDREELDSEFDEVVDGVYPDELGSYAGRELSTPRRTPAYLYLLSARASGETTDASEAAGLQLVHAGLDATRRVLERNGWGNAGREPVEGDMVLLAADVLVTVGFDRLLDEYEAATRLVNTFGEAKARALEADNEHERFERVSEYFVTAYTTAVEVGGGEGDDLSGLAESLAVVDLAESSGFAGLANGERVRAARAADRAEGNGYDAYVDAVRTESSLAGRRDTGEPGAEVGAQD